MARSFVAALAATLVLAGVLALGWSALSRGGGSPPGPSPRAAAGLLPDLRMAQLDDVELERADDGRLLLRFTATIVNVGTGPMELVAALDGAELGRGVQRVYHEGGEFTEVPSAVTFFWAGDGHDHWHARDLQGYRVEALDGSATAVSEKHGFCLFDNAPLDAFEGRAPDSVVYECPSSEDASTIRMGLSVGWRDIYPATLPNQFIDISDLPAGRYRLWAEADPASDERPNGWFVESVEDNNQTWVEFELDPEADSVEVLGFGPSA